MAMGNDRERKKERNRFIYRLQFNKQRTIKF